MGKIGRVHDLWLWRIINKNQRLAMMPIDNYELLKVGERKKLSALGSVIASMMTLILNYDKTKEANHPKSFCVE